MKVEQLKAELVVFKGLMSNVSAAPQACDQAEQAFLAWACGFPGHSPHPPCWASVSPWLAPHPTLIQEERKEQKLGCRCHRREAVWPVKRLLRGQTPALQAACRVALLKAFCALPCGVGSERQVLCRVVTEMMMHLGPCWPRLHAE